MKKELIISLGCIFFIFILLSSISALSAVFTAKVITGDLISQPTNVSVFILPSPPILNIISPQNVTYLTNISLLLNFTVSNADNLWYNLDGGSNIILNITPPSFFNASEGFHTIYVYANKSGSIAVKNVTFNVNLTRLIISYIQEFRGIYRGASTDFYSYSYEQLQNLSDICLEDIRYGKICFKSPINVINDEFPTDNFVPLQENTNISYNNNGINATALPNFNKSAIIWIYNLTLINPRILRDGSPCSSLICTYESYIDGVLKFNVTGFSYYSADENPSPPPIPPACANPPCGGGSSTVINNTPPLQIAPCIAQWQCSNWSTSCIDGFYRRECSLNKWYCAAEIKPITERKCSELPFYEKPASRFVLKPLDCCIFGICWFRYIICWYWWVLILIVLLILIYILSRYLKKYRKQIIAAVKKKRKKTEDNPKKIRMGEYIEFKTPKRE